MFLIFSLLNSFMTKVFQDYWFVYYITGGKGEGEGGGKGEVGEGKGERGEGRERKKRGDKGEREGRRDINRKKLFTTKFYTFFLTSINFIS